MCGIAGILNVDGSPVAAGRVRQMVRSLEHRGPDELAMHVAGSIGLGHARLSIIDLKSGQQPMANEDGSLWITFNGEIFNYIELRDDLVARGHRFATQSDTEVILHAYEQYGPDCVTRMNGQWAFAIWDDSRRELFLSRDRMGVRPLFYTTTSSGHFAFASEAKALFQLPDVGRELDVDALDQVFTFWATLAPTTMFVGVSELQPGHSLTVRDRAIEGRCYWRPSYDENHSLTEQQFADQLFDLLVDATRLRLRADVPVGAYLSGGLDSSIVTALAKQLSLARMPTFSITFGESEFDESTHQRQVAEALGTEHRELRCTHDDIVRVMPDVVFHTETPLLRTSPAPMYLLAQMVRRDGYKVVLTGEGADEIFGGYDIFKEAKLRRLWAKHPQSRRGAALARRLYPYLRALQRQPAASIRAFFGERGDDLRDPCFSHLPRWRVTSRLKMLLSDAMKSAIGAYDGPAELVAQLPPGFDAWDPFCQSQYLEMTQLLPGYILSSQGDRVAMAHGVEGRFPFLDPNVVTFASRLPPMLKMRALNEKHLLKQTARPLVPAAVWRRSKQPYRSPGAKVFLTGRNDYIDELLAPSRLQRDDIFDASAVGQLVTKCRDAAVLSVTDDMALVGIISTQLIVDRFIHHPPSVAYGNLNSRTAYVHHR
jgi:asparagine synthase (glutamine-hydrolysing)